MRPEAIAAIANAWLDEESRLAVADFERNAHWGETFPRPIERVLPLAIRALLVPIPDLRATRANAWLMARGREHIGLEDNRPLHGCFLGWQGSGFIFVDANDPLDERRFTIAHEVGHLIVDYLLPRQRAIAKFGVTIVDVMDGRRAATITETFRAVLTRVPIGPCVSLMERRSSGQNALDLYDSEDRADRIALALLAPALHVLQDAEQHSLDLHTGLALHLTKKYGLPTAIARAYAAELSNMGAAHPTPYDRLARA